MSVMSSIKEREGANSFAKIRKWNQCISVIDLKNELHLIQSFGKKVFIENVSINFEVFSASNDSI